MVYNCCIKNCKSIWKPGSQITFHNFPKNFKDAWINNIPPNLRPNSISSYAKICSQHFTPDSFRNVPTLRDCLSQTAIPTIFENMNGDIQSEVLDVLPRLPLSTIDNENLQLVEETQSNVITETEIFKSDAEVQTEPFIIRNEDVSKNSIGVQACIKSKRLSPKKIVAENKKSLMSPQNLEYFKQVFEKYRNYIYSLKIDDQFILQHERNTFALGFLINMNSFYDLASDLFEEKILKYLLTYKCSQDHIELSFSGIRTRGGWNNNPNCLQLKWALRQILIKNNIKPSLNGNYLGEEMEGSVSIIKCDSNKKNDENINCDKNKSIEDSLKENQEFLESLSNLLESVEVNFLVENILYYIAGCIIHKLLLKIKCKYCHLLLLKQTNNDIDHCYARSQKDVNRFSSFTSYINRGYLCFPSEIVYKIVLYSEKAFIREVNIEHKSQNFLTKNIITVIMYKFLNKEIVFDLNHPVLNNNSGLQDSHESQLIKLIATEYIKIRLHAYAKKKTLSFLGNRVNARQQLTKTVLFYNI